MNKLSEEDMLHFQLLVKNAHVEITQHAHMGFVIGDTYGQYWNLAIYGKETFAAMVNDKDMIQVLIEAWIKKHEG